MPDCIASLAPVYALPTPPPDSRRFGKTRSNLLSERLALAKYKSYEQRVAGEAMVKNRQMVLTERLWGRKEKKGHGTHGSQTQRSHATRSEKSHRKAAKEVAMKPNRIPQKVANGVVKPCRVQEVYLNPDQPSALDSYDVPMYSSFSPNHVFNYQHPTLTKPIRDDPLDSDTLDSLVDSFTATRSESGMWFTRRNGAADTVSLTDTASEGGVKGGEQRKSSFDSVCGRLLEAQDALASARAQSATPTTGFASYNTYSRLSHILETVPRPRTVQRRRTYSSLTPNAAGTAKRCGAWEM